MILLEIIKFLAAMIVIAFLLVVLIAIIMGAWETPDSSLDLYHEKNAVATLKYYINKGNSLFITSNERSSYLIDGLMDEYGDVVNIIDLTKLSRYRIKETV